MRKRVNSVIEERRQLGNSDLFISPLGLGAWSMGGPGWLLSWGAQDDNESIATIHRALDIGINWIDTAPSYGLGHSEEIVGRAIKGLSRKPYVLTKCSLVWNKAGELGNSLKPNSIRREVEQSLKRLALDVIDLYQIHWPYPDSGIEEGCAALAELQKAGKVRHIGICNFSVEQMRRAQRVVTITSLQPQYSLVHREIEEEILPHAAASNFGVIVWSPLKSGLLAGTMSPERVAAMPEDDWRRQDPHFQEPWLNYYLGLVEVLRGIGQDTGFTAAEVAIAWALHRPEVTGAIIGARKPGQLDGLTGGACLRLNLEQLGRIQNYFCVTPLPGAKPAPTMKFP